MRFVVIGSGIIGISVASALARHGLGPVTVLEKESGPGRHTSGRNSGVIHSGINQKPGTLKARLCLEGSRRLREYCRRRGVPMLESGTLVMARNGAEAAVLERLRRMGLECGVEGLEMLTRDEFLKKEPLATPAVSALFSPTGASVDAHALVEALAEDARSLGVEFRFVEKFERIEGGEVVTTSGRFRAEHLVNCAGLYADRVAHAMGVRRDLCIIPFRGEYMEVRDCAVSGMIYQPPDLRFPFLSVHLTREADGRVLAGPTAVLSLGREAYDKQICWPEALGMFVSPQFAGLAVNPAFLRLAWQNAKTCLSRRAFLEQIRSIVPSIRADQIIPFRAGIRAQMVDRTGRLVDDMVVEYGKDSTHVLNVVSPGMTCSLAFAEHIVDGIEARV